MSGSDLPTDDEILALVLGRSKTLRAPTLRRGKTLLVGFNNDAYAQTLG
ncbi:MAG: hypothetical protein JKY56_10080 [Kofleriaceae bacterium]|nr:hypothetical protein [Kofleriaceae bacterium]